MTNISDVYGMAFGPVNNDQESSYLVEDTFDPGSHEAKLQEAQSIPIPTIHNGNGKDSNQENKKKVHFIQKHSESDLIAEAVIVAGVPYFAVARTNFNEITLEKSLPETDASDYRPFS